MPAFLTSRFEVWSEIWTEIRHGKEAKIMTSLYAFALTAYGFLIKFYPALVERAHKVPTIAALLSLRTWIIVALLIILFLTLEGAYRVVAKRNKELADLKEKAKSDELSLNKSDQQAPDIYGRIKEVYLRRSSHGLYITLLVLVGNKGADTTLQPFRLRFLLKGREHSAIEDYDLTDYSIVRPIDKPLWPSMTKEEMHEPLNDLSEDNLKPLERNRFREGWLGFRIPRLPSYMRGEGGEVVLEIIDATDRMVALKESHPWPQSGYIRLTEELNAEWDEAVKRAEQRQRQAEDSDSQDSAPPNVS